MIFAKTYHDLLRKNNKNVYKVCARKIPKITIRL